MPAVKKIVATVVALAVLGGGGYAGYRVWRSGGIGTAAGTVYVQPVREINSAGGMTLSGSRFTGVIETQKTEDFKYDSEKKIKKVKVKVGDTVKKGDVLFVYDDEALQLEVDQAQVEYEKTQNEIETNKVQLADLQKEKANANAENITSLTTQILSLQSDIAKSEYDLKTQANDIEKKKKALKNNKVKSTLDGIVKKVADLDNLDTMEGGVLVSISRGDDYTVKGTINEQLIQQIYVDMPVIIRSRIDDTKVWSGVISSIDTKPQTNSNTDEDFYYMGGGEEGSTSSKYSFYIKPESFDGLMLGQHIIIEPDPEGIGDSGEKPKEGIWLYEDFLVKEGSKTYVWAQKEDSEKLEKREVTIGEKDEENGDCEIVKGLDKSDMIAYPSDEFKVGMKTTDNYEEATVPEEADEGEEGDEFEGLKADGGDDGFDVDFGEEDEDANFDDEDEYAGEAEEDFGFDQEEE